MSYGYGPTLLADIHVLGQSATVSARAEIGDNRGPWDPDSIGTGLPTYGRQPGLSATAASLVDSLDIVNPPTDLIVMRRRTRPS